MKKILKAVKVKNRLYINKEQLDMFLLNGSKRRWRIVEYFKRVRESKYQLRVGDLGKTYQELE